MIILPKEFIQYLLDDGPMKLPVTGKEKTGKDELCFPELEEAIESAIKKVGGKAFIKLNWTAPQDSSWINGTLQCKSALDVFGLLKASELIVADLTMNPTNLVLAIREWRELEPSMEFRCFVKSFTLVAACQRKCDTCYNYDDSDLNNIRERLATFYDSCLGHSISTDGDFVFDVYLDTRSTWLVGLNILGPPTNPILFEWKEILSCREKKKNDKFLPSLPTKPTNIELRVAVASSDEGFQKGEHSSLPVIPGSSEFGSSRVPADTMELFKNGGIEALADILQKQKKEDNDDSSSSSISSSDDTK